LKTPSLSFQIFFQIDVKTDEVAIPALNIITKLNAEDRVCIASFNSERLERIRNINSNICISMGPKEILRLLLASFGLYKKPIQGDNKTFKKLIDLNVDGIITDKPKLLIEALNS
jgi:glycerophosphoryl diester phosphodiesterase